MVMFIFLVDFSSVFLIHCILIFICFQIEFLIDFMIIDDLVLIFLEQIFKVIFQFDIAFPYLGYVCFLDFTFQKTTFQTFQYLFVIRKVGQRKTLSSQRKIWLGLNLGGKHFPAVVKKLEMSYYLLIISNLVLKILIAIYIYIYISLNIYFSISSLKI